MDTELEEVLEIARSTAKLDGDLLREWMVSPNAEIRGIAYTLLNEQFERCNSISEGERIDFTISTLTGALKCTSDLPWDSFQFGQFDALLEVNRLLRSWKSGTSDQRHSLDRLVELVGDLCLTNDGAYQQLVMDVTFEHIMTKSEYRQMFVKWRSDSRLRPVFERACAAAEDRDRGACRLIEE